MLALYFLVSLFSCFEHFIGVLDCSVGRSMRSCYHGVQGKGAFYLTPDVDSSILMMVSFKGNSRGQFNKTFTSVIYECSHCFRVCKQ